MCEGERTRVCGVCVCVACLFTRLCVNVTVEHQLILYVGAKLLCRFEKITALEAVAGNVNVGSLPTISVGRVQGAWLRRSMRQRVLIVVRSVLR